jgi:hypothetical protein
MSLTPYTPDLQNKSKSEVVSELWKQPGMGWAKLALGLVLFLAVGGIAVWFDPIMHSIVDLLQQGVIGIVTLGVAALLTTPIWEPHMRNFVMYKYLVMVHNMLKSDVEKDPIGYIRVQVAKVMKRVEEYHKAIVLLNGSKMGIINDINQSQKDYAKKQALAHQADLETESLKQQKIRLVAQGATEQDIQELDLSIQTTDLHAKACWSEAGEIDNGLTDLQDQLKQVSKGYFNLSQIANVLDATAKRQSQQADYLEKRQARWNTTQKAVNAANSVLSPDAQEIEITNIAINKLNADVANTMGAMEELERITGPMIIDNKLQTAANASLAQQKFEEIAARLQNQKAPVIMPTDAPALGAGSPQSYLDAKVNSQGQFEVPAASYDKMFNKKN